MTSQGHAMLGQPEAVDLRPDKRCTCFRRLWRSLRPSNHANSSEHRILTNSTLHLPFPSTCPAPQCYRSITRCVATCHIALCHHLATSFPPCRLRLRTPTPHMRLCLNPMCCDVTASCLRLQLHMHCYACSRWPCRPYVTICAIVELHGNIP